jgi:3-oxoacyl-[acyl-carrier protein] reductase
MEVHVVSGVTSGMGKAYVDLLLRRGNARIIAVCRSPEQLPASIRADAIVADFSAPQTVEAMQWPADLKIDTLVNFAGILPGRSINEYDAASLGNVMAVNTISPILLVRRLLPHFNDGGKIILLGSISAQRGSHDEGYAASKAAIHAFVRALAGKVAPRLRVVGIAPGMTVRTRMTDDLVPGRFEHNLKTIPMQRALEPEEVAQVALDIQGPAYRSMTGCIIDLNGGQYMR